jgi:hypothetical protein
LVLAASEDDIPPILAKEEDFVPAEKADLDDLETVIGLFIGGEPRAYPVRLLSLHEVVNDQVGGETIAVTWCPLCYTAIVYNRKVNGQVLTFGASGYLLNENLVLIDHQSETLWSQLLGQGIKGGFSGEFLDVIPSSLTTWESWKKTYPKTLVLSLKSTGKDPDQIKDPYQFYYSSGISGLSGSASQDELLAGKSLVLGVTLGDENKAYPLDLIQESGLIHDQLGSIPVVILNVEDQETPTVFSSLADGEELTFFFSSNNKLIKDHQTDSSWDPITGKAINGEYKGFQLSRIPASLVFWFAWSSFYPETCIFEIS